MAIRPITFRFTLTHPNLTDLTIPISTFTARVREGTPSYLQVTIPDYYTYSDSLLSFIQNCRQSTMYLYKTVNSTEYEIMHITLETATFDEGSQTQSVSLTGHRTFYNESATTVTIIDASYTRKGAEMYTTDVNRIRCSPYNIVSAGDTAIYTLGGVTTQFEISLLTLSASETSVDMEISSGG